MKIFPRKIFAALLGCGILRVSAAEPARAGGALAEAEALFEKKDFAGAEAQAIAALGLSVKVGTAQYREALAAFNLAGRAAQRQMHYAAALDHFHAAAALTARGRDPLEWAAQQWKIGETLEDLDRCGEAETVLQAALAEYRRVRGEEDAEVFAPAR